MGRMMRFHTGIWLVIGSVLLLAACTGPKTPEEVTLAFWEAVVAEDAQRAVRLSTLEAVQDYDAFSRDWHGMAITLGTVVIDGERATVKTSLDGNGRPALSFVTHLVRQDGKWRVNYRLTGEAVRGAGALDRLFGQFSELGRELSEQLKGATESLSASLEGMAAQFAELSEQFNAQLQQDIGRYSEILRENLQGLSRSIERALRDLEQRLSKPDRQKLQEAVYALEQSAKELAEPSLAAIGNAGTTSYQTLQRLESIEDPSLEPYQQQWQQWLQRIDVDMHKALSELDSQGG